MMVPPLLKKEKEMLEVVVTMTMISTLMMETMAMKGWMMG
jgi:hypothetical protein